VTELVVGNSSGGGGMVSGRPFGVPLPGVDDPDVDGLVPAPPGAGQVEPRQNAGSGPHCVLNAVWTNVFR
jgi:hypothetical protein